MTEEIFEMAKTLGSVAEADWKALRLLCAGAERELRARLPEGTRAENISPAFVLAAAWSALADLCTGAMENTEAFSAGDVSIRMGRTSPGEQSATLRQRAEALLAPYVADRTFSFLGVRG